MTAENNITDIDRLKRMAASANMVSDPDRWQISQTDVGRLMQVLSDDFAYIVKRLNDLNSEVTRQHGILWLLGLDNHEDEEPQRREVSHRNLDKLLNEVRT